VSVGLVSGHGGKTGDRKHVGPLYENQHRSNPLYVSLTIAGHNKFAFSLNNSSNKLSYMSTVKLCPRGSVVDGLLPLWNRLFAQLVKPGCSSLRKIPRYLTRGEAWWHGWRETESCCVAGTSAHLRVNET
jgi:hypothetical protein